MAAGDWATTWWAAAAMDRETKVRRFKRFLPLKETVYRSRVFFLLGGGTTAKVNSVG